MTSSDRLWNGIFFWICIIYHLNFAGIEGHHDNFCSGPDGRNGLCVRRRYCREAANQFLNLCGSENYVCCPIPTHRSAQPSPPFATSAPRTTEATTKRPERRSNDYDVRPTKPATQSRPSVDQSRDRSDQSRPSADQSRDRSDQSRPSVNRPRDSLDQSRPSVDQSRDRSDQSRPSVNRPGDNWDQSRPSVDQSRDRSDQSRPSVDRPRERPDQSRPSVDRPRDSLDQNRPSVDLPRDRSDYPYPDPRTLSSDGSGRSGQSRPVSRTEEREPIRRPPTDEPYPQVNPPRRPKPSRPPPHLDETPVKFPNPPDIPLPQVPACGVKPYDLFIAGGVTSEEHEWPWMAAIFRRHTDSKPKTFQCGGSLINTRYVLTAAHCFAINQKILPASSFVVRLGSHSLNSGEEYAVSSLVLHYNHSGMEYFNDIALVRLSSEVYVNDKVAPICLPTEDMARKDFVGRMGTVAGWGDTYFRSEGTRVLKHVSVPIVSNEECAHAYRRVRGAVFLARGSNHVMCAGLREGGRDACQGDSGGPLMLKSEDDRWTVIGIVSLGYKCAEPGYFGVYTRVTHYLSWINDNMRP